MPRQVFLGGASSQTTWRSDIAIPILQTTGITFDDPQFSLGAWSEACESAEMQTKDDTAVLLFVIDRETPSVAAVAEVA